MIRDWEDGTLDPDKTHHEAKKNEQKSYIISLSKQYSIVTTLTSFVAIEEREKVHIVGWVNPFKTKTQNIYSQEEINLYCIIKLAT